MVHVHGRVVSERAAVGVPARERIAVRRGRICDTIGRGDAMDYEVHLDTIPALLEQLLTEHSRGR